MARLIYFTPTSLDGFIASGTGNLEREFDPQLVRRLMTQLPYDIAVAGPDLAAQAIRAGLVGEYHLLVVPAMLGGGRPVLPASVCARLHLLDERRFSNGMVYLRYRTQAG